MSQHATILKTTERRSKANQKYIEHDNERNKTSQHTNSKYTVGRFKIFLVTIIIRRSVVHLIAQWVPIAWRFDFIGWKLGCTVISSVIYSACFPLQTCTNVQFGNGIIRGTRDVRYILTLTHAPICIHSAVCGVLVPRCNTTESCRRSSIARQVVTNDRKKTTTYSDKNESNTQDSHNTTTYKRECYRLL